MVSLNGCLGENQSDLRTWMRDQRALVKPNIPSISEPKKFTPQPYTEGAATDPFNATKLTQALRRDGNQTGNSDLIVPELSRRKEALEAFPLDSIIMVGSLDRHGQRVALVSVDKLLYQVRVGNHLGMNYGQVVKIDETTVNLREIVQDAAGEWIERSATLQLQEKTK